jgi:hypothetical protein
MKRWLQEITNMEGIEGVFISSGRAKIIAKLGLDLNDSQLQALALYTLRIVAAFYQKTQKINEIEFYWKNLFIIGRVASDFLVITVCTTPKVLALLRITLNVTLSNLLEDKKFMRLIKEQAADKNILLEKGEMTDIEKNLITKLK